MSPDRIDRHVSLSGDPFVCDICGQELTDDEPMVALAGNATSSAFKTGFINPFTVDQDPRYRPPYKVKFGPWELCRLGSRNCNRWHSRSRPGCAVHPDCLQLFMRNCTAHDPLDRLLQTCTWRRVPWTGAAVPNIRLLPKPAWYFEDAFISCAEMCGLKGLDVLPHVVIGTILEWLPRDDCFWRCVTAMHMAKSLSVATVQPLRIVPLSWLVSWERGSPPKVASEEAVEDLPSFVRFTIDRDGLSKVERLADRAHFNRERFDDRVFVVEREDAFGPSLAIFKNGLLQLSLLEDFEDYKLPVWDTPTPPDFTHCLVKPERHPSMFRYHSIDLAAVTGITFFIYCSDTLGVHSHSRAHPCAMATYQQHRRKIPNLDQYCSWVYVPLPPGDTVLTCGPLVKRGIRDIPAAAQPHFLRRFLIRMRLSGETIVGRYIDREDSHWHNFDASARYAFFVNRPEHPPTTLLYSTGLGWPKARASTIIPYSNQGLDGTIEEPWHPPPPQPGEPSSYGLHSHAPLENVRQVRMFYYSDTTCCKGMLIDYDDGGQRALGDCRLYVDASAIFERPSRIAILNPTGYGEGVEVLFDELPPADEMIPNEADQISWSYYKMTGTLDFWFSSSRDQISVRGGTPIPREELLEEVREG